jgi:hypothetical protein
MLYYAKIFKLHIILTGSFRTFKKYQKTGRRYVSRKDAESISVEKPELMALKLLRFD